MTGITQISPDTFLMDIDTAIFYHVTATNQFGCMVVDSIAFDTFLDPGFWQSLSV